MQLVISQRAFTCSKSRIETLKHSVKFLQIIKTLERRQADGGGDNYILPFSKYQQRPFPS